MFVVYIYFIYCYKEYLLCLPRSHTPLSVLKNYYLSNDCHYWKYIVLFEISCCYFRRVAVFVVHTAEQLFYNYILKAEGNFLLCYGYSLKFWLYITCSSKVLNHSSIQSRNDRVSLKLFCLAVTFETIKSILYYYSFCLVVTVFVLLWQFLYCCDIWDRQIHLTLRQRLY